MMKKEAHKRTMSRPKNSVGIPEKVILSRLYPQVGYTKLGYTIRPFGIT